MPNIHSSINFALVNIPVTMNPIIKNNDSSFNQLHEKCGSRINYVKYCPKCKIKIKEQDIIKGYEYEQDKYIVFKKEDLEKLANQAINDVCTTGNPRETTKEDILNIYKEAYE